MRRVISLLFMCAAVAVMAQGQAPSPQADDTFPGSLFPKQPFATWSFGVFAGPAKNHHVIDVAYATDMKYTDGKGTAFGLSGEYHPTGWFSLRSGLAFVPKNYRMDRDNRFMPFVYTDATNNYLSIPVEAIISVGRTFRLYGFFGGYAGYWLSGHRAGQSLSVSYLFSEDEETTSFDEDYVFNKDRDNRFDAGFSYGVGIRCSIVKKIDLSTELHMYYSTTDIQKQYMSNLNPRYNTTRVFQFGIAYWL